MLRNLNYLILILFVLGCKTAYLTKPFDYSELPNKPYYEKKESWAVIPGAYPDELKVFEDFNKNEDVDIFYIYPTIFTNPKLSDWNADVFDADIRKDIISTAIKYQASCFSSVGNLYVPFYRQSHYRSFIDLNKNPDNYKSWEIAYNDIENAFVYYLNNYNNGKPIIIASHSQGSLLARRILKKFFDGKPLQNRLIAAYIPGIKILKEDFTEIKLMTNPEQFGGFVSWNTYKRNKLPKNYDLWYKGGVTSNPISWDSQKKIDNEFHLGLLYFDNKIYPKSLKIELIDGMVWTTIPKVPNRFFIILASLLTKKGKDFHFADINLFWEDIKQNSIVRINKWKEINKIK